MRNYVNLIMSFSLAILVLFSIHVDISYAEDSQDSYDVNPITDICDHDFYEWELLRFATSTEEGLERRDCKNCRVYEERTLPLDPKITAAGFCGKQGDNLLWELKTDGTLRISGAGEMQEYSGESITTAPWGKYADQLKKLELESGITVIGGYAFLGCSELSGKLIIPDSVTQIWYSAFERCSGFTGELVIPDSVTKIWRDAFRGCSGFTGDLIIPDTVVDMGYGTFARCTGFTGELYLSKNLTCVGESAFEGCTGFTGDIVIPDDVITIGDSAFYNCKSFDGNLVLGENIEHIGSSAFGNCRALTGALNLPQKLTTIEERTFEDCRGLTGELIFPPNISKIKKLAFVNCLGFNGTLIIPEKVVELENAAFSFCQGIEKIIILNPECIISGEITAYSQTIIEGYVDSTAHKYAIDNGVKFNCISHSWNSEYTVTQESTCTEKGWTAIDCKVCNAINEASKIELEIKAHEYSDWVAEIAPTCENDGKKYRQCVCGDRITEIIPATGHAAGSVADCENAQICETCGTTLKESIGHSYRAVVTAPTCTEEGYTTFKCSCGDSYVAEKVTATGHINKETISAIEATCTETGLTEGEKCQDCGVILTEQQVTNALGHASVIDKAVAATRKSAGKTEGSHCSRCNNVLTEQHKVPKISTVKFGKIKLMYTGKIIKPTVMIKNADGKALKSGVDYKLSYKNGAGKKIVTPKNVGKYTMIVTFQGKYRGSASIKYTVVPKITGITKLTTPAKKQIKAVWTKRTAQVDGYEVWFSTNKNFTKVTTKKFTVAKAKTNFKLVKNLKSKKTYHVKVRTYKKANGVKYYSNWSAVKKLKTK